MKRFWQVCRILAALWAFIEAIKAILDEEEEDG